MTRAVRCRARAGAAARGAARRARSRAQPRASFPDVEDEVMCDTCNVRALRRRVAARRPAAPRDPRADRARADEGRDQGHAADALRRRDPRPAAGRGLQPRRLPRAAARRASGSSGCCSSCCRAGAGASREPALAVPAAALDRRRPAPARRRARAVRRPVILAAADTTIVAAFAVGFISFISPCVLPLVPGYLSAISGISIAEMRAGEHRLVARARARDRLLPVVHA